MLSIRADMNTLSIDRTKVQLNGDLPQLRSGMRVRLYEPSDFEVEAVIENVITENAVEIWYGILD